MIRFLPNLLTLLNLISGCFAVVFIFSADLRLVSLMIFVSLALDYLDGMAARLLKIKSDLGRELDSLADLVSFGLVPSLIAYIILDAGSLHNFAYVSFLMTAFSAYRLAKFNLDSRQTENFIGLPTPANAIFWSSLPLIISANAMEGMALSIKILMSDPLFIIICILAMSFLLTSGLPMFSLKFRNLSWPDNKARHIFLVTTLILFFAFSYYAIPFIILLYILISAIQFNFSKK